MIRHKNRSAFTLMELLIVLAVLVLIAAIAIPKVIDTLERGRSATQAYSTADISRHIETYFALNNKYPDGWDVLISESSSTGSDGATTTSQGLYSKLPAELKSPNTLLMTTTLAADQITSLNSAGIGHIFMHDSISAPSDSGTDRRHLGTGTGHDGTPNISTVVVINTAADTEGLHLLIDDFGLNPNRKPVYAVSPDNTPRIAKNIYVVFGIGPKSTLVQSQIQEAPSFQLPNNQVAYGRALAVFEVPNAGTTPMTKAKLVGVFGPDGRSKRTAIQDYNNVNGVPPH